VSFSIDLIKVMINAMYYGPSDQAPPQI